MPPSVSTPQNPSENSQTTDATPFSTQINSALASLPSQQLQITPQNPSSPTTSLQTLPTPPPPAPSFPLSPSLPLPYFSQFPSHLPTLCPCSPLFTTSLNQYINLNGFLSGEQIIQYVPLSYLLLDSKQLTSFLHAIITRSPLLDNAFQSFPIVCILTQWRLLLIIDHTIDPSLISPFASASCLQIALNDAYQSNPVPNNSQLQQSTSTSSHCGCLSILAQIPLQAIGGVQVGTISTFNLSIVQIQTKLFFPIMQQTNAFHLVLPFTPLQFAPFVMDLTQHMFNQHPSYVGMVSTIKEQQLLIENGFGNVSDHFSTETRTGAPTKGTTQLSPISTSQKTTWMSYFSTLLPTISSQQLPTIYSYLSSFATLTGSASSNSTIQQNASSFLTNTSSNPLSTLLSNLNIPAHLLTSLTPPFHPTQASLEITCLFNDWLRTSIASIFPPISNLNYNICDSYPSALPFPPTMTYEQFIKVAKFRSKNRVPFTSFVYNRAILIRCAQPCSGWGQRCIEDEMIISQLKTLVQSKYDLKMLGYNNNFTNPNPDGNNAPFGPAGLIQSSQFKTGSDTGTGSGISGTSGAKTATGTPQFRSNIGPSGTNSRNNEPNGPNTHISSNNLDINSADHAIPSLAQNTQNTPIITSTFVQRSDSTLSLYKGQNYPINTHLTQYLTNICQHGCLTCQFRNYIDNNIESEYDLLNSTDSHDIDDDTNNFVHKQDHTNLNNQKKSHSNGPTDGVHALPTQSSHCTSIDLDNNPNTRHYINMDDTSSGDDYDHDNNMNSGNVTNNLVDFEDSHDLCDVGDHGDHKTDEPNANEPETTFKSTTPSKTKHLLVPPPPSSATKQAIPKNDHKNIKSGNKNVKPVTPTPTKKDTSLLVPPVPTPAVPHPKSTPKTPDVKSASKSTPSPQVSNSSTSPPEFSHLTPSQQIIQNGPTLTPIRPKEDLIFFDCRPYTAALGNALIHGKGYENAALYNSRVEFLDIPNIHEMRSSYESWLALISTWRGLYYGYQQHLLHQYFSQQTQQTVSMPNSSSSQGHHHHHHHQHNGSGSVPIPPSLSNQSHSNTNNSNTNNNSSHQPPHLIAQNANSNTNQIATHPIFHPKPTLSSIKKPILFTNSTLMSNVNPFHNFSKHFKHPNHINIRPCQTISPLTTPYFSHSMKIKLLIFLKHVHYNLNQTHQANQANQARLSPSTTQFDPHSATLLDVSASPTSLATTLSLLLNQIDTLQSQIDVEADLLGTDKLCTNSNSSSLLSQSTPQRSQSQLISRSQIVPSPIQPHLFHLTDSSAPNCNHVTFQEKLHTHLGKQFLNSTWLQYQSMLLASCNRIITNIIAGKSALVHCMFELPDFFTPTCKFANKKRQI